MEEYAVLYGIKKELKWEMGHRLVDYEGPCARMHGHSYVAEIWLQSRQLNDTGFVVDFAEVKAHVQQFIDDNLDHRFLVYQGDPLVSLLGIQKDGELVRLDRNPTAENIAGLLAREVVSFCTHSQWLGCVRPYMVVVRETATGSAQIYLPSPLNIRSVDRFPRLIPFEPHEQGRL